MYTLEITEEDARTIAHVGWRYDWSMALSCLGEGTHELAEHEAWHINDAFESDTDGGHSHFPMLAHDSKLASKLFDFMLEIV